MKWVHHLTFWTITHNPRDYPGKYVLRPHFVGGGWQFPGNHAEAFDTLEEARAHVPQGCHRLGRHPNDDAVIVESWLQ